MLAWALYGQAYDSYESFVVATYTTKDAAKRARKQARKQDKYHSNDYWEIRAVLLDPSWENLATNRWEFE